MTTGWGAPRHAYKLTENLAVGDRESYELAWARLGSNDRADVVIALGAQARLAANLATTSGAAPLRVPADYWDRIACEHIRAFAVDAWQGTKATRVPRHPCEHCLRIAAEALADLHVAALAAVTGLSPAMLAGICGRAATSAN